MLVVTDLVCVQNTYTVHSLPLPRTLSGFVIMPAVLCFQREKMGSRVTGPSTVLEQTYVLFVVYLGLLVYMTLHYR